jgi:hypothetical protein
MPSDNDVPTAKPAWMSPIETRQARADYYFRTVLDSQHEWYEKNAGKQKDIWHSPSASSSLAR